MIVRGLLMAWPALVLGSGLAFAQTAAPDQAAPDQPAASAPSATDQQPAGEQTAAAGDAAAGEKTFAQCKACHTLEQGKHRVGPSLHGVIGRKAGSAEGFKYSDAMMKSGIEWTPENLDKYLADPKGFIPGNKMAFAGLKKPEDRQNVVAYLQQQAAK